jgi:photosystem II stability/assembly factor-like uncharacterized protein
MRKALLPIAPILLGFLVLIPAVSPASSSGYLNAHLAFPNGVSVVEAIGVPEGLTLPWLLPPPEAHLPGILVGNAVLLEKLSAAGVEVRVLGEYFETKAYFLIHAPSSASERTVAQFGEILWSNGNDYLVCTDRPVGITGEAEDWAALLRLRLDRLEVIERSVASLRKVPRRHFQAASSAIDSVIGEMVDAVSESDILDYLESLTGEKTVALSGGPDTLLTRYSYHPQCRDAAEYIYSQFDSMGLEVEYDDYFGIPIYSIEFVGLEGYAVGSAGSILHTEDGGDTWEEQVSGTELTLTGTSFIGADSGWVCGSTGLCIRTFDGGSTWDSLVTGTWDYLYGVDFINALNGWLCGNQGTLRNTADGGLNWSPQSSGTSSRLYDIDFVDADNGWAVGISGVVIHTSDGGANWLPQTSGTSMALREVCFVSLLQGWIIGDAGTILHTSDGGTTWVPQSSGSLASLQGVCFSDSLRGWVVGYGGEVIYTNDGGATWVPQDSGTGTRLFGVFSVDTLRVWAGGISSIIRTTDAGSTWTLLNDNVPTKWRNVVATKSGSTTPSEIYIVCGHFDSISEMPMIRAPGADDNATGTSLVLEAASALKDYLFMSTVRFVCFSGEEEGLIGSDHYAANAHAEGDDIAAVLNFDMVGYGTQAIYLIGNDDSGWLVDYCIGVKDDFVPTLGITKQINSYMRWSDHASFWDRGYSAFCGIETQYMVNPYYHSTGDTVGNLTIPFVADVTKLAVASLASLAGIDSAQLGVPPSAPPATSVALGQNYPNPFNPLTHIPFTLPATGTSVNYVLAISDPAGRMVKILEEGETQSVPLDREVLWDGTDASGRAVVSGIYVCSLRCGEESRARKIVLLR